MSVWHTRNFLEYASFQHRKFPLLRLFQHRNNQAIPVICFSCNLKSFMSFFFLFFFADGSYTTRSIGCHICQCGQCDNKQCNTEMRERRAIPGHECTCWVAAIWLHEENHQRESSSECNYHCCWQQCHCLDYLNMTLHLCWKYSHTSNKNRKWCCIFRNFNSWWPGDTKRLYRSESTFVQVLFVPVSTKALPEPVLVSF